MMQNLILPPDREYRFGRYLSQLLVLLLVIAGLLLLLKPSWVLVERVQIGGLLLFSTAGTGALILAVTCLIRDPGISRKSRNRWLIGIFVLPLPAVIAFFFARRGAPPES
jgi:hypothetical protein